MQVLGSKQITLHRREFKFHNIHDISSAGNPKDEEVVPKGFLAHNY